MSRAAAVVEPRPALRAADLPAFARLNGPAGAPLAVAVSGGGDSLALMLLAAGWAERAGRPLTVLTVDHGLQTTGAAWAQLVADRAWRLGLAHRTLVWRGPRPLVGLPAAARAARHALLAEATRALGARVLLMAHTADDVAEAEAMRAAGSTTPSPRVWAPSPAWPEGRGVFVLRPLLRAGRAELRAWLAASGERWIDDPANDDDRFARTRARRSLAGALPAAVIGAPLPLERRGRGWGALDGSKVSQEFLDAIAQGPGGELSLARSAFSADPAEARRRLSALLLCAAGTTRPPRSAALDRLLARLATAELFTATLAGARIEAGPSSVLICREAGELARRPAPAQRLGAREIVFDGRFVVSGGEDGDVLVPLAGRMAALPSAARQALAILPPAVRPTLPAVVRQSGQVCCPIVQQHVGIMARPLSRLRLDAALGGYADEASLWRVAKPDAGA